MKRLCIAAALVLGCIPPQPATRSFHGPDGEIWFSTRCGRNVDDCYSEAGRWCPKGWEVSEKRDEGHEVVTGGPGLVVGQHVTNGVLVYRCKTPDESPAH